jgi:hypothetical protein
MIAQSKPRLTLHWMMPSLTLDSPLLASSSFDGISIEGFLPANILSEYGLDEDGFHLRSLVLRVRCIMVSVETLRILSFGIERFN